MERLEILVGDITLSQADAIVSADVPTLLGSRGVSGAIRQAAGAELAEACRALHGCPRGQARITNGFGLPAAWILHTSGPVWEGGTHGEAEALAACYRSCLALAEERGLKTLDFCSISTGGCGYPLYDAATVALRAIMEHLRTHPLPERVRLVCHTEETARVYRQMWNFWFAVSKEDRMPT